MRLRRTIRPSLRALFAHRVRALLALSSVAIGVAAVVLTSALGAGAQRDVMQRIETMGTNLLIVRPVQAERLASRRAIRGFVTTLKLEDAEAIAQLPRVAGVAPAVDRPLRVKADQIMTMANVMGTTPSFSSVRRRELQSGRFFDAADDLARVAVLGATIAESLAVSTGATIRIRGVPFEVIGVLEKKGVLADGSDEDNLVLVPIRTALRRIFNVTWINTIYVSVDSTSLSVAPAPPPAGFPTTPPRAPAPHRAPRPSTTLDQAHMNAAQADIAAILRARHRGRDDFSIQNTAKFLSMQRQTADFLTLLGTSLAGIALVVGGTGILALMLMSVKERTAEIGLRRAVGATPKDILVQFLFEATLLAVSGWLAGLAIGACGAAAVALATTWTLALPLEALLATAAMVLITGLGFGAFPARKASLLPPIEALLTR